MALPQVSSLTFGFTKMLLLHPERQFSSIAIRSTNVPRPTQCMASQEVSNNTQTILRRSTYFQPSIWTYDYVQSLSSEYKEEMYAEQCRVLREEVRMMLSREENQLELIDVLQRLGVAYHFENEINNILENIYNTDTSKKEKNLHAKALEFRLLRQHGYNISTDVFDCFKDEKGNFKTCESVDVEGMLSLYEASFLSLEDETILDEARDFTSEFLKQYLDQNRGDHLSLEISHTLEFPLHWRIPRGEALWFINAYERKPNMSPALLQFAKLDFNILQAIYQEELKHASRWWKSTSIGENLTFARDRMVENFIFSVGINFEPDFAYFRKAITKVIALITAIDDVYDLYGTLEELEIFTKAVDRWDLNAMDSLPDYMRICFKALYNFVEEMTFESQKQSGYCITPYLKKTWEDLCKSYLIEAKWYHTGYKPSFEEYIKNAWISISGPIVLVHAYFSIPHSFRKNDLVHLEEYCDMIRFSSMISRLSNDLGTYKRENETGDVPKSIECYMNESGACEEDAREYVKSLMCTTWKKMNEEARNCSFSQSFIDTAINLGRVAFYMYQHGDYAIQDPKIKSRVLSLMIQPIPVNI